MTTVPLVPPVSAGRRIAPVVGADAWRQGVLMGTTADPVTGDLVLRQEPPPAGEPWPSTEDVAERAGLAFDRGHVYHGVPERGQIERMPWPRRPGGRPVDLLAAPRPAEPGGPAWFVPAGAAEGLPLRARALATDPDEHLFVLDGSLGAVAVVDLSDGRLLRTITPAWPAVDLAAWRGSVLVATADRRHPLVELDALRTPRLFAVEPELPPAAVPSRVAIGPDGAVWLLLRSGDGAWIVPVAGATLREPIAVPGATDIEIDGQGRIVAAGPPRRPLRSWTVSDGVAEPGVDLLAAEYDGRGIVRTPDGRIGFWNGRSLRIAAAARVSYLSSGHADTFALDSQVYRQQWGRVFLEACVPPGTDLTVAFATADELSEDGPPEAGLRQARPLHRRVTGRELPWAPLDPQDRYEVYEAPIAAPPGRHLWIRLRLAGTTRVSPRVRALRAEFPSHDLVEKLPRTYRRDPAAAAFLRRYLAMIDGLLGDLDRRAADRDLLFDPRGAPEDLLPWLASLIGLTLDERWPVDARRTVLAEAIWLYRRRGTVSGLRRLLEIYLRCPVVILEEFRLRGSGGALVGGDTGDPGPGAAVVGSTFRVGGEVAPDPRTSVADAFRTHAHRFSVLIARDLDADGEAVVHDLLDLHRPAHTMVTVCTVGHGMRVGRSLHLEVSTIVGPSSGFRPAVVGATAPGSGTILGPGRAGIRTGRSHLGEGTVIDP